MDDHALSQAEQQPGHREQWPQRDSLPTLHNRIGDDTWQVQVQGNAGVDAPTFSLDFSAMKDLRKRQALQETLLYAITGGMGWADQTHRLVATSNGHARKSLNGALDVYRVWSADYNALSLQSLSADDTVRLLRTVLEHHCDDDGKPLRARLIKAGRLLNATYECLAKGLASDGCLHRVTEAMKEDVVTPLLAPLGIDYAEWNADGSYGGLPIDVALVWLMEATEIIHARETKILLAYFAAWRVSPPASSLSDAAVKMLRRHRDYQESKSWPCGLPATHRDAIIAFGEAFDDHAKQAGIGIVKTLPWRTIGEITDYCRLVRYAGSAILHLVAGNRVHEVVDYRTDQWAPDTAGNWWYRSAESKSNKGGNADRTIDPLGAHVVDILNKMSYLDPCVSRPVLGATFTRGVMQFVRKQRGLHYVEREIADWNAEKVQAPFTTTTVRANFKAFYQSHLVAKHPELGKTHPETHPHQARHFFADVALRWMDPRYVDIIAKLREHYLHKDDAMIYAYTNGKRSDDVQGESGRHYLLEILQRIVERDPDDPWFGAAANRIRKECGDISVLSPEELADLYEEMADHYLKFVVWEWGICAVQRGEESNANCSDNETGMPNLIATDREKAPEVCNGCVHQLAHTGFRANIHRIALSCQARGKLLEELERPRMAEILGYEPQKRAQRIYREMTA